VRLGRRENEIRHDKRADDAYSLEETVRGSVELMGRKAFLGRCAEVEPERHLRNAMWLLSIAVPTLTENGLRQVLH
jgi:hypothetical protein